MRTSRLTWKYCIMGFLLMILVIQLFNPTSIIESLTNPITNQILLGVGADYKLYTYMGDTWKALKIPKGLATNPILLALTLAPDGDLYCIGNDFNVYTSKDGGWTKPKQPTGTDMIGIAIEGNDIILVGQDYKLHVYNPSYGTIEPLPGNTAPVISMLNFQGERFGVGKDHKLYKWLNNQWSIYDDKAELIYIGAYNNKLMGVSTDKKLYTFGGSPGKWTEAPGNKQVQLLSIFGMNHSDYTKLGFN